jgi:hypothetical protein
MKELDNTSKLPSRNALKWEGETDVPPRENVFAPKGDLSLVLCRRDFRHWLNRCSSAFAARSAIK